MAYDNRINIQTDALLRIDGIEGESNQKGHEKWLELRGWAWSQSNAGSSAIGSGAGSGKAALGDFEFEISTGSSSPKLFLACATGQHIRSATLHQRKAGGSQEVFLEWKFIDVLISGYDVASGEAVTKTGSVLPVDHVKFNFSQIETEYKPQKSDGTLDAGIKTGFNIKTGSKV